MDAKKFLQLVEEKKKIILAKKEAPLKWEQKLEAAAKAKADTLAKQRKAKKQKKRSNSGSDYGTDSNDGRKRNRKSLKKRRKHYHSESEEEQKRDKNPNQKPNRRSSGSEYDNDSEGLKRKKHGQKKYRLNSHPDSTSLESSSAESDDDAKRRKFSKHHRHHRRTHSGQPILPVMKTQLERKSTMLSISKIEEHIQATQIFLVIPITMQESRKGGIRSTVSIRKDRTLAFQIQVMRKPMT